MRLENAVELWLVPRCANQIVGGKWGKIKESYHRQDSMVDFSPFAAAIATAVVFVHMAIIIVILLKIITK
jgi:hypothetical protein